MKTIHNTNSTLCQDKNAFDVALNPAIRDQLKTTYSNLRQAEQDAFDISLNDTGQFLPGCYKVRDCPLCGNNKATPYCFVRGMHIVTCEVCGFTYSREVLTSEWDQARYSKLSTLSTAHTKLKENPAYKILETLKASYIIYRLSQYFAEREVVRLLDIGCSTGAILVAAGSQDWQAKGVETNPLLVETCRQKDLDVTEGFFPDVMNTGKQDNALYDIIVILDVLEHTEDPIEFLTQIKTHLKQHGLLAVQVPNFSSLLMRLDGGKNNNFCHGHWGYFTPETLEHTLRTAGFSTLFLETYISELDKINQYPEEAVAEKFVELTGETIKLQQLFPLSASVLHDYLLGYKLFGVFKLS